MMKTFIALGLASLALGACTDTVVLRNAAGENQTCTYSLMYSALKQCVADNQADGYQIASGPTSWTYNR
jgi:hypothetical protein